MVNLVHDINVSVSYIMSREQKHHHQLINNTTYKGEGPSWPKLHGGFEPHRLCGKTSGSNKKSQNKIQFRLQLKAVMWKHKIQSKYFCFYFCLFGTQSLRKGMMFSATHE